MSTASGRRSGAVYGEKLPKTRLARIYCYGDTLYTVNLNVWQGMFAWSITPGFEPRRSLLFFFFFFLIFLRALSRIFCKIYICVAGKARQIMAYFCQQLLY